MKEIAFWLREALNIFVADGSLALGVLFWVAGGAVCIHWLELNPRFAGLLLFLGVAGLLVEAVRRQAGGRRKQ